MKLSWQAAALNPRSEGSGAYIGVEHVVQGAYGEEHVRAPNEMTDTYAELVRRIEELSRLEANWDSYGAPPLSRKAVATAQGLLRKVMANLGSTVGEGARPFAIAPMRDGGIQVEWRTARRKIELEIGPEGRFGCLLIEKQGGERRFKEEDDVPQKRVLALVREVLTTEPPT